MTVGGSSATAMECHQTNNTKCLLSSHFGVRGKLFLENYRKHEIAGKDFDLHGNRERQRFIKEKDARISTNSDETNCSSDDDDRTDENIGNESGNTSNETHSNVRRVSWADELVTVHTYIKEKKTFRLSFVCMPRFSL